MTFIDFLIQASLTEANKGNAFEKHIYQTLEKWLNSVASTDEDVDRLFAALSSVDPHCTINTVAEVYWAGGSPTRPLLLDHSGSVIADLIFLMKNGSKRYVSIKHKSGSTFANLGGATDLINPKTFAVNKRSEAAALCADAGMDVAMIQQGYSDRANNVKSEFRTDERVSIPIIPGSALYDKIQHGWGKNYLYLREDPSEPTGWFAMNVNGRTQQRLLNNLVVYRIKYPHNRGGGSKQISIFFKNDMFNYELEIRNTDKGELPNKVLIKTLPKPR